ncbi:MAG: hypothetical protein AB8E87_12805 [Prochlorococcus sp.]
MRLNARILLPALLLLGLTPAPLIAQPAPQASEASLAREFRDGFLQGCKTGKTPGVRHQTNYCTCLANSYEARYNGRSLAGISQLAKTLGQNGATLINLMMAPEAKACANKF